VKQKIGKGIQKWRENKQNKEHDKIIQYFPQVNWEMDPLDKTFFINVYILKSSSPTESDKQLFVDSSFRLIK
jgi:hypothetical protein